MSCVFCKKPIDDTQAFLELSCGKHLGHSHHGSLKCVDYACVAISSHVLPEAVAAAAAAAPQVTMRSDAELRAISAARVGEPLNPPSSGGLRKLAGGVMRYVSKLIDSNKPDKEASGDPFTLLQARIPLRDLVGKHGYDITELINDHGVTVNDFFRSGYTLGEMCDAFSSRMNPREGMDVLYYLGVAAEHIRALPQYMPVEMMREKLGYKPEMLETLGFRYDGSESARMWTLPDMVRVGLNMPLVMKAGLCDRASWERLKATAQSPIQLLAFGATPDMEAILDVVAPAPAPLPFPPVEPTVCHSESSLVAAPVVSYSYFDNAKTTATPLVPAYRMTEAKVVVAPVEYTHAPGIPMPGRTAAAPPAIRPVVNGPKLVPRKVK